MLTDAAPTSSLTPTERALAEIWREVLGVDAVSPDDNFFALGGHSLKAMQAVVRTRRVLGVPRFNLADMFRATTLRGLAETLDAAPRGQSP